MKALITISTQDGQWAPPRVVELVVTEQTPSGLGITNAHSVRWTLTEKTRITAAAISAGSGWMRVDMEPVRVAKRQDAVLAARSIVIDVGLPRVAASEIDAQGQLKGRLREISR